MEEISQTPGDDPARTGTQVLPEDSSLDSLLYQRPEHEGSYLKGEGPSSPDNNDLENVLDSILDSSSASSHLHSWTHFAAPEVSRVTPHMCPSDEAKALSIHHTSSLEETSLWAAPTLVERKEPGDSMPLKGKNSLEETKEPNSSLTMDSDETVTSILPILPPDLNLNNMPILPLNPAYLAVRARQILGGEEGGQRSSPDTFQTSIPYANLQPNMKQISYFYPDTQPDFRIKKESSTVSLYKAAAKESTLGQDYGSSPQNPSTPDPDPSLNFILYKNDSACDYDSFKISYGNTSEGSGCVLPSTSAQTIYQPLSLNGHQHITFQPTSMKETYLSEIQLPYVSYISDGNPDPGSPFSFETFPQKICLICGDEASGCHYGVLTCGSCKVFFKRAIEGQHNYLCAGRNDCIVDKIRRKNCPSCRLRKCCQAGMVLGGRKFKKFGRIKTGREIDTVVLQSPPTLSLECQQILIRRISNSSAQEIQFTPELLQILQSIEPEVVYAGYDNTQPETPSALLSSLNQLCERQLVCVVKWSKSLPGFRNLHIDDQITLLQYSWMSLMVFALGWRSYQHVSGQMLYFAPDLILNEQRMKDSSFYTLCLSMWQLPQEFMKLQVTHEEFLCMKALLLLNTIPLEGLKSQTNFDEMRSNYIRELAKAIGLRHKGVIASSQRFYQLTKLMDSMHELVKQLHLYCLNTFLQSRSLSVEFPEMMSEVISAQLPKILAGMVKPLVFHKK
ncbi:progesterone receptor L homeolog isoform X1 [Xenopus laevis]|uniref:Progesterone receptor n=1 Tax=Xenopus laevis TaxID=8355 RepID=A0A8J1M6S8_XENLA|nr:progesterone receptor L homeolog isoform X1 [Xenopus laevis]